MTPVCAQCGIQGPLFDVIDGPLCHRCFYGPEVYTRISEKLNTAQNTYGLYNHPPITQTREQMMAGISFPTEPDRRSLSPLERFHKWRLLRRARSLHKWAEQYWRDAAELRIASDQSEESGDAAADLAQDYEERAALVGLPSSFEGAEK